MPGTLVNNVRQIVFPIVIPKPLSRGSKRYKIQYCSLHSQNLYEVKLFQIPASLSSFYYPRGRFGGRHPLCGIGVTSLIIVISKPATCNALTAASRPGPGPFTSTDTVFIP